MDRKPVSNREYQGIRYVFAMQSILTVFGEELKARLRLRKAWRWWRLAEAAIDKACDAILSTVPPQKLTQIKRDLDHIKMETYVDGVTGQRHHGTSFYLDEQTVNTITEFACGENCTFCTKRGAAAKQCRLRKAVINVVPWDLKTLDPDGTCKLSGEIYIGDFDKDLPTVETMEELDEEWSDEHPQEVRF